LSSKKEGYRILRKREEQYLCKLENALKVARLRLARARMIYAPSFRFPSSLGRRIRVLSSDKTGLYIRAVDYNRGNIYFGELLRHHRAARARSFVRLARDCTELSELNGESKRRGDPA